MSKWKTILFTGVMLLMFGARQARADTSPVVLTFEGAGDNVTVGNFYNGGAGGSFGIVFGSGSLAVVSVLDGGSGNFKNAPSGDTIVFFSPGPGDVLNVAGGFNSGFSLFYSAALLPGSLTVWSGLNGTGTMLAALSLPLNGACATVPMFCIWTPVGVTFSGTAESVDFSGATNIGFDNITLGSATPGGAPTPAPTPEPATILLLGLGSLGLLGARRNRLA
jgi:hypothetical protein